MSDRFRTQRITHVDIDHGRIRIPVGQKGALPPQKQRVAIRLRGVRLDSVAWDPRYGPDRERSGVLYVGRQLRDMVTPEERLEGAVLVDEIDLS
jgi:hypothetical protein